MLPRDVILQIAQFCTSWELFALHRVCSLLREVVTMDMYFDRMNAEIYRMSPWIYHNSQQVSGRRRARHHSANVETLQTYVDVEMQERTEQEVTAMDGLIAWRGFIADLDGDYRISINGCLAYHTRTCVGLRYEYRIAFVYTISDRFAINRIHITLNDEVVYRTYDYMGEGPVNTRGFRFICAPYPQSMQYCDRICHNTSCMGNIISYSPRWNSIAYQYST